MSTSYGYYKYQPSAAAAGVFAVLFAIPTLYHCYLCFRTRTWFMLALIIGGFFELIGYASRLASTHHLTSLPAFVTQMLLILLAPSLFAASLYMLLGRLMAFVAGPNSNSISHALIPPRFLTKLFVVGDVASFLLQCMGGGITAAGALGSDPDPAKVRLGNNVIKIGLVVQVGFFAFFLVVGSWWKRGVERDAAAVAAVGGSGSAVEQQAWRKHFWVLMGASGLVFVRCVFRVAEYLSGQDGALLTREWYAYVFDAVLMLGVVVLYAVVHPGEVLGAASGEKEGKDGLGMELA
ncbi:rta1-domain-containing protein [Diplodia corticola]|uniref:Rta1-domain-containing protein n=1 Tax=Diplodia corticola TaxID=236234 RepID=A0A1J9S9V8_9PEZI|nr:rta1-domain-containing protein [Diplodia corticola]OJD36676.1 rta1-domain-containing protein [Diplodia corticola]